MPFAVSFDFSSHGFALSIGLGRAGRHPNGAERPAHTDSCLTRRYFSLPFLLLRM